MITIQILADTPDEEIRETRELIGNGGRSIYDTVEQLQAQVAEIEGNMTSLGTDMAGTKEAVEALQDAVEEVEAELADSGWKTITLAEGIAAQNATTYPCRYRKIGKVVYIEGCVKGLTEIVAVICTLPAGYRPNREFYYQAPTNAGKTDTFRFYTDGRIERMATTNTPAAASQYHFIKTEFIAD